MLLSNMLGSLALFSLASLVRQGSASPKPPLSARNLSAADPYLAPYSRPNGTLIPNDYVVMLHENHTLALHYDHIGQNLSEVADMFYHLHLINAYRARLDNYTVHNLVRSDPGVRLVEHDVYFYINETLSPPTEMEPRSTLDKLKRYNIKIVSGAGYWLQMITTDYKLRTPVPNGGRYQSLYRAGMGVHLYVLDTGIRLTHKAFEGRAVNFHDWKTSPYTDGTSMDDDSGHGTLVAGIAAGRDEGVAMGATIVNVKVAHKHYVSMSALAHAVNDVTEEHRTYRRTNAPNWRGSVINISAGGDDVVSLRAALDLANLEGVVIVTGAGNSNTNVNNVAPCMYSLPTGGRKGGSLVCVGGVDNSYKRYLRTIGGKLGSNYGDAVQLAAPCVDIIGPSFMGDNSYTYMTGTSFASAMTSGALATYVGWEKITFDPGLAFIRLKANWLDGVISYGDTITTALLQTGINKSVHGPYVGAPSEPV